MPGTDLEGLSFFVPVHVYFSPQIKRINNNWQPCSTAFPLTSLFFSVWVDSYVCSGGVWSLWTLSQHLATGSWCQSQSKAIHSILCILLIFLRHRCLSGALGHVCVLFPGSLLSHAYKTRKTRPAMKTGEFPNCKQ